MGFDYCGNLIPCSLFCEFLLMNVHPWLSMPVSMLVDISAQLLSLGLDCSQGVCGGDGMSTLIVSCLMVAGSSHRNQSEVSLPQELMLLILSLGNCWSSLYKRLKASDFIKLIRCTCISPTDLSASDLG
jgi:hypothetical protein